MGMRDALTLYPVHDNQKQLERIRAAWAVFEPPSNGPVPKLWDANIFEVCQVLLSKKCLANIVVYSVMPG